MQELRLKLWPTASVAVTKSDDGFRVSCGTCENSEPRSFSDVAVATRVAALHKEQCPVIRWGRTPLR